MNAPVCLPPTPRHRFTEDAARILEAAGVLVSTDTVRLVDGRLTGSDGQAVRFTLDEVLQMVELGALDRDARVELIDGELLEMSPQNAPHMEAKRFLVTLFIRRLGDNVAVHVEGTLNLAPGASPSPDVWLHDTKKRVDQVRGPDVSLLIEIADTSLLRDLGLKADLYARYGVADYWVVDAYGRRIFVHRNPSPEGYRQVLEIGREDTITPLAYPDLTIRAGQLPIVD